MKTRIHVNQHRIKSNRKIGGNLPVLTCKTYLSNEYAHEAEIHGPSIVVYSPEAPLKCGAHVWVETNSPVTLTK
jgi:hypothetical protein